MFFVLLLSIFAQDFNAREEGQKLNSVMTYFVFVALSWWCDLEFSSNDATENYGY